MPHLEVCCSQSPCPHRRPLLTRASAGDAETLKVWPGSVSYEGLCSFLLAPGVHKVLFVPSKSLFIQSCGSFVINPTGLQSQIPWGLSVPL